jgi:hypothetical protein
VLIHSYGGQTGLAERQHQFCLAHHIRDAQYAMDAGNDCFAPGLIALLKRACRIGRSTGPLSRRHQAAQDHRQNPPKPLRLPDQSRGRGDKQCLRTCPASLHDVPQNHQRVPNRVGRPTSTRTFDPSSKPPDEGQLLDAITATLNSQPLAFAQT